MESPEGNRNPQHGAPPNYFILGLVFGIAIGAGIGSATGDLALWLAIGVAVGAALGAALNAQAAQVAGNEGEEITPEEQP